jgi:tRNA G18 (ribose-2'-O)-methylase SpoU
MALLATTSSSQDVCAVVQHKDEDVFAPSNLPSSLVICDGMSDPGNLGTIIRTSYGVGIAGVIAVRGCSPWVRREL